MDHAPSKLDIVLVGQLGNWLFLTASAALEFGRDRLGTARNTVNTQEEFDRSARLFRTLCPWLPLSRRTPPRGAPCSYRQRKSNWQSLRRIPSREVCRDMFRLPDAAPVDDPVIHVRGGDYLTFFGGMQAAQTADSVAMCAEALGADVGECTIVTDDPAYVQSLGLSPGRVVSGGIVDDFMLMANARRLAISPSTFSWWAGFLGRHDAVVFPQGFGPWDGGALDTDMFSAHSNAALCWGGECRMAGEPPEREGTACVLICTGRYRELFPGFLDAFSRHARGGCTLYVLTDDSRGLPSGPGVRFLPVRHGPWPDVVLHKYHMLLQYRDVLSRHRGVVMLQANARLVADMDFSVIGDGLNLCFHPYDGDRESYVCGGLVGGCRERFFDMAEWVARYMDGELAAGRMPRWHDETALNEYWRRFPDRVGGVLPSWTMYAEERPGLRRDGSSIMLVDKTAFFGCRKDVYAV